MEFLKDQNQSLAKRIDHFILNWQRFALDYWWRKKYKIPFGSRKHREQDFFDMVIEFREDLMMNKARLEQQTSDEYGEPVPNLQNVSRSGKEVVSLSEIDIEKDYEEIDLSQFDKI